MKVRVFVVDGSRIEEHKGEYDPDDQLVEIKRKVGTFRKRKTRFQVVSSHIKHLHNSKGKFKGYGVFVDAKERISTDLLNNGDDPVNQEIRNTLDYLVDKAHFEVRKSIGKIGGLTLIVLMFAGYGIIRLLEWMIFYVMQAGG